MQFANYFTGKIDYIHLDVESRLFMQNLYVEDHSTFPVLWDIFQFIWPEDMDGGVFGNVRLMSCTFNAFPSWPIKASRASLTVLSCVVLALAFPPLASSLDNF